ncbi:MAG: aminotransferase class V-fold PLP-dependent enzyme, partial [Acidimicrobiia bacterium]|nr:aminotransferase class V-fold PLP-dependent enzyme [Acidimicrobiia bacterium]MDX2467063.1 aminotransferase class V-fold PLP-dependent enzyme [Acidimicrobiia bacterium]
MEPWTLDPTVVHLNHGSFGACPQPVLEVQDKWRAEMESNPILFFMRDLQPALDQAREVLAGFVGADPAGMVFVPNATYGINSVLRSLEPSLGPGDEILITDHTYNACRNVAAVTALRSGATLVEVPVPFPLESAAQFTEAVLSRVSEATRVVMIDAVTSPTALLVPVAELIEQLEPAIPVLVDAAHAPGMIPLELDTLGASFVVGNCHKWMCAPKSSGFLFVREDRRDDLIPATVSHGWNTEPPAGVSRFHSLFDWTGTDDPSARLSVPAAISTMASLHEGGWDGVMATNRELALQGRKMICDRLRIELPIPESMIGSMAAIPLPGARGPSPTGDLDPITERLRDEWQIEVPVFSWRDWPTRLLRLSAQLYNTEADYERL